MADIITHQTHPELSAEEISSLTRQTNYGTWRFQKTWKPLYIADAEGCWFTDGAGKRYLDFSAQLMCVNLGHKNPAVVEAIGRQARELAFVGPGYATDARARLSAKLLEVLPAGLDKFFFATSGTEANEAAFKIARMYTGKNKIISRYRSYHGSTMGSIAATGDPRRWAMEPAGKGARRRLCAGDELLRLPHQAHLSRLQHCLRRLHRAHDRERERRCGNHSGAGGRHQRRADSAARILPAPARDLRSPRRADDRRRGDGGLGPHRQVVRGRSLGREARHSRHGQGHHLSLCAAGPVRDDAPKIADYFEDHYFSHGHTYEAHPITLGPAVATIEEMQRLKLVERAAELEPYVREKLEALKEKHPSIGDVRGLGLFFAVELVKNRKTKQPFNTMRDKVEGKPLVVDQIAAKMMADGVAQQAWVSHFVIAPPLIVTKEELDLGIDALDRHLGIADALVE